MLPCKTCDRSVKLMAAGGVIISVLLSLSLLAPLVAPFDPLAQNLPASLSSPGDNCLFGTDSLGRDVFSRVIYGSRISLAVGIIVLTLTALVGTVLGTAAGYCGGFVDATIMRLSDVLMAFPPLVLAMIAMAFMGPGLGNLIGVLVVIRWPQFARLVRGQVISVKNRTFVDAAGVSGTGAIGVMVKHILPNCFAPVIAYGTMSIGAIIVDETALSFLGLGIQPPDPSWGVMLADAKNYITTAPWLVIFPGLFIMVTIFGFNLFGDGLGYLLNPRQDERNGVNYGNIEG